MGVLMRGQECVKHCSSLGERDSEWIGRNVAVGCPGSTEGPFEVRHYELSDTTPCGCVIFISVVATYLVASSIGGEQI